MNLHQWAIKWQIPMDALEDLRKQIIDDAPVAEIGDTIGLSETAVQNDVRMEASIQGHRLWRNNNGAGYNEQGHFMRWGLANESEKVNKSIKSSDLIGIRKVWIQPSHVGTLMGQFIAREAKPRGWVYTGTAREKAQLKFLELVIAMGGDGQFANDKGTI